MAQELWQIAKPFGRPAKFKTAQELWQAFLDYVEWSTANPMTINDTRSQKVGSKQKAIAKKLNVEAKDTNEEKMQYKQTIARPFSLVAFRLHAGIKRDWATFKSDYKTKGEEFCGVLQAIEESIRQQQVENAMVGNYKENIVSRINNISDTIEQKVTGDIITRKGMSVKEAKALLDEVNKKI